MSGSAQPLRILIAALGGEGGGVMMNWVVAAARATGHGVQATSVPGVAQRTGSTTYYIEIAGPAATPAVLGLMPMPGRVDVVVSSELVETARLLAAGFVSPKLTTLVTSTARQLTTAEKMAMGDGRYDEADIREAARKLARRLVMLDLGALAEQNRTFVSATMFGALAGSGVLPWDVETSRSVMGEGRSAVSSRAGFDAAFAAAEVAGAPSSASPASAVPDELAGVTALGATRCADFQDAAHAELYLSRVRRLSGCDLSDHRRHHAAVEAARRLALWMTYEDLPRVADLKTRPERFARIREEAQMSPDQVLTVTEFFKPRAEEIADILPEALGRRLMARVDRGKGLPLLGSGLKLRSNGILGFWLLRLVAQFRRLRRRSFRFRAEERALAEWLDLVETTLGPAPEFAAALAELPRVLKGYSDTLVRGRSSYARIMAEVVRPALASGQAQDHAPRLRAAISAALADESHARLDTVLGGTASPVPILQTRGTS